MFTYRQRRPTTNTSKVKLVLLIISYLLICMLYVIELKIFQCKYVNHMIFTKLSKMKVHMRNFRHHLMLFMRLCQNNNFYMQLLYSCIIIFISKFCRLFSYKKYLCSIFLMDNVVWRVYLILLV